MSEIKRFVNGASKGVNAREYLASHREWLVTTPAQPILVKLDAGEVYPTPALSAIVKALVSWALQGGDTPKASKVREPRATKQDKPYQARIVDELGVVVHEYQGDTPTSCERWCDGKLVDLPHHKGEVECVKSGFTFDVTRDGAFARLYGRKAGPSMKRQGGANAGWTMRCRNDVSKFSQG